MGEARFDVASRFARLSLSGVSPVVTLACLFSNFVRVIEIADADK